MSSPNQASKALMEYMSKKLLDVAELNTVLDQFGGYTPIPSLTTQQIRFVRQPDPPLYAGNSWTPYRTYVLNSGNWDFGGFDFGTELGPEPIPLETKELSASDREELERLLEF